MGPTSSTESVREREAMTDPNINATAQSVADQLAGTDGNSNALPYRLTALLQPSQVFSLGSTYPYPEGPNTTPSVFDQVTTLAKVLTRTWVGPDGKTYDLFDAVMTLLDAHLSGSA
jgi:hypothetical protein